MTGYLKKAIWIFSILFLLSFFNISQTSAQESFSTSSIFNHNIKENGKVETTLTFTISSPKRTVLTYYTITIPQEDIEPEIFSTTRNRRLESTVYNRTGSTDILIDLENTVIPEGGSTKLSISFLQEYSDDNIITLVSKVADSPTTEVGITYPKDWGETNWVSDQIDKIKTSNTSYVLRIPEPDSSFIKLIFGEHITYDFEISKSFNNMSEESNQYEVIIPNDNEFQKIVINDINIKPTQALLDNSNNYVLIFTLEPETQADIKISGNIIMGEHKFYAGDVVTKYDSRDIYWSLENRQIERIDGYLAKNGIEDETDKEVLTEYIYKYIVDNLTPSSSATSISGGVRRGASEVLNTTEKATPEDYADVLRAILTYYDIPSIYTVGYVSEISSYQDTGMFHYWVQAYNGQRWVVLDPYLEDYSNVSLFGREQLDHISILHRKHDSISPILTYYSDNDIRFEYSSDKEIQYSPESNISISLEPYSILNKYLYGNITVDNTGNTIFTGVEFENSQPELNQYIDSVTNTANTILLPNMYKTINFHIPFNEIKDNVVFATANIKNGDKNVHSEDITAEYSVAERTGYEVLIKFISIILFLITFSLIYLFIDKIIYKK